MKQSNTAELSEQAEEHPALILVVDDEESICTSLSNVLRDEQFRTLSARDGDEALEMVRLHRPDLVFLDIWMPGRDGIETLERIKALEPDTEVVMISGHATISTALEAMKLGAMDFIEKPFDIDSVIITTSRAIERRRRLRRDRERADRESALAVEALAAEGRGRSADTFYAHAGIHSSGWRGRNLGQRTLKDSVILYGQCLHSGMKSGLVLEPLPVNSGLHFTQMGSSKPAPIFVDYVESTNLATTVRSGSSEVGTIEHLMAALHAFGISNLLIKCNGEVPIFDGSAEQFCSVIESVGIEEQGGEWYEIAVQEPLSVAVGESKLEAITIEPAETFSVTYELDYPAPVGRQEVTVELGSVESFRREVAPARTFGFMRDVERLYKAGLGAGARLDNFILIGPEKVINTELRFEDELARHKILDIVGDLFLIGRPIRGAVHARMTGHSDNIELLRKIRSFAV